MIQKMKTKLPAARIKRIMRQDEEVGKVSQLTPFLVGKAVELFLKSLIDAAVEETISKQATKLTETHM